MPQAAKIAYRQSAKGRATEQAYSKEYRKRPDAKFARFFCLKAHRLRLKDAECILTGLQLRTLYNAQNGVCPLTGRSMVLFNGMSLDSASVDKIDQTRGYVLNNIRWVTWQANTARSYGTDKQLIQFCRDVLSANGGDGLGSPA